MTDLSTLLVLLAGIAIRLAIPILITALAVYALRKLDARWQREGSARPATVQKPACWEIMGCPLERQADCPARVSPLPCWQVRRQPNGYLNESCLACKVFLQAPAPQFG